jgi:hypothetical protein
MTKKQFERKHPGFTVQVLHGPGQKYCARASGDGDLWASVSYCNSEKSALNLLSQHVLAIKARFVLCEQGGRDANTGEVKPMQIHHKIKRSAGGNHSRENLAGVSPETHDFQHHRKK